LLTASNSNPLLFNEKNNLSNTKTNQNKKTKQIIVDYSKSSNFSQKDYAIEKYY